MRGRGYYLDGSSFETTFFRVPVTITQAGYYMPGCVDGKTLDGVCPQIGLAQAVTACK